MKNSMLLAVLLALVSVVAARPGTLATDLTGTWLFSVDLETGGHGDPTFVFKQDKDILTGTYDGPIGQYKITGTVKDNKAVFGFEFTTEGVNNKAMYTGTIEEGSKMSGTMEITDGRKGKWTATRK